MTVLWVMIVIGGLALLQSLYYQIFGTRKVEYKRFFSRESLFAGEHVELIEVLQNRKFMPLPWLRVEARISSYLRFNKQENLDITMERFHRSLFFLRGYRRVTRRHDIECTHRGFFNLKQTSMTAGDLFGFIQKTSDLYNDAVLYVYPRIYAPEELPSAAVHWQGEVAVRRWIMPDPMLVDHIREYRPGDPQKSIHWGATARMGELQVKVMGHTVRPKLLVALNTQAAEELWGQMTPEQCEGVEKGVSLAAGLISWGLDNGLDAGFVSNGTLLGDDGPTGETVYIEPASSQSHMDHVLKVMARLVITRQVNFYTLFDNMLGDGTTGADILVISNYWSDALEGRAKRLRETGNTVVYVPMYAVGGERRDDSTKAVV